MKKLPEAQVARSAECHKKQKAGYGQYASPQKHKSDAINNKSSAIRNITSPAIEFWQKELAAKSDSTKDLYLKTFYKFLEFTHTTADELLTQRQEDQTSPNPKIQRLIESQLLQFIAAKRKDGLAPATLQLYFAAIRSFFEIHYYPLRIRRGDYPTGESLGVKVASKEAILKAVENKASRNKATIKAAILFLKDSGLRVSDARLLNYGDIREQLERGDTFIQLTRITQKQKTIAKTFIGPEVIHALKAYLQEREHGSRHVPPETLTDSSPLFRTWASKTVKRLPRGSFSSLIRQVFTRINQPNTTAHSLRKYLQTNLEAANINTNWIDQILGHKLINSRDAYSKPTDEQLHEAYTNAYKHLRIYPDIETPNTQTNQQTTTRPENLNETTNLPQTTFQYTITIEGQQRY